MTDKELIPKIRTCLANRELMEALNELLNRDDQAAVLTIRAGLDTAEPIEIIRNNERFRRYFTAALKEGERNPFNA